LRQIDYHVDNANVHDASALAIEITKQLTRFGGIRTSTSKIITDICVTVFETHNAAK